MLFPVPNNSLFQTLFALCQINLTFPVYVVSDFIKLFSVCVAPKLSNYSLLRRISFYLTLPVCVVLDFIQLLPVCIAPDIINISRFRTTGGAFVQVYARTVQAVLLLLNLLYAAFLLLSITAALSVSVFRRLGAAARQTAAGDGGVHGRRELWARRRAVSAR